MAVFSGPEISNSGLVLHLDAANQRSYPGTGTSWTDLSSNGNNGTLTSVDYSTNPTTLSFNSSDDNVLVSHSSVLNFNGTFTVSSWIKVNSFNTASIYNVVSKKPSYNNTQKGWSCQYDFRTTGILQYRNNNGTVLNDHTPTSSINNTSIFNQTENFVNSVWVLSGNAVTFYINGIQSSIVGVNYTDTDTSTPLYIGKSVGSTADPSLIMNLGAILIYNRALTAAEVRQNFEAHRDRYRI